MVDNYVIRFDTSVSFGADIIALSEENPFMGKNLQVYGSIFIPPAGRL